MYCWTVANRVAVEDYLVFLVAHLFGELVGPLDRGIEALFAWGALAEAESRVVIPEDGHIQIVTELEIQLEHFAHIRLVRMRVEDHIMRFGEEGL